MIVLATTVVRFLLDHVLPDPRRHDDGRDTQAQSGEVERDVLSVGRLLGVHESVTGRHTHRRCDMIAKPTVLVEGHDEEGVFPLRAGAQGLVDALDVRLARAHR